MENAGLHFRNSNDVMVRRQIFIKVIDQPMILKSIKLLRVSVSSGDMIPFVETLLNLAES